VVRAIRREVGESMPIFFRFSQWKQQDFKARPGRHAARARGSAGPISDAGVDVFDGSVRYFDRAEFEGSPLNLSGWARKLTGKLAMAIGGIGLDRGFYDSKRDGRRAARTTSRS
jgi:2,4-dienoyl-CoA reductase-like NADH-dependent reductase (Old Yellow Enzyme family)